MLPCVPARPTLRDGVTVRAGAIGRKRWYCCRRRRRRGRQGSSDRPSVARAAAATATWGAWAPQWWRGAASLGASGARRPAGLLQRVGWDWCPGMCAGDARSLQKESATGGAAAKGADGVVLAAATTAAAGVERGDPTLHVGWRHGHGRGGPGLAAGLLGMESSGAAAQRQRHLATQRRRRWRRRRRQRRARAPAELGVGLCAARLERR